MNLYFFRSAKQPDVFSFTTDPTGANLPTKLAPWHPAGSGSATQSYAGRRLDGLGPFDLVIKAVEKDGFYLARSGLTTSSSLEWESIH